ncbi:MAG: hypothetical protein QXE47_02480 [Candidatus Anstonellales archaeon]
MNSSWSSIAILEVLLLLVGCIYGGQKNIKDVLNNDKLALVCKAEVVISANQTMNRDQINMNIDIRDVSSSIDMVWRLSRVDLNITAPLFGFPITVEYQERADGYKEMYINILGQRRKINENESAEAGLSLGLHNLIKTAIQESNSIEEFEGNFKTILLDNLYDQVNEQVSIKKIQCKVQSS